MQFAMRRKKQRIGILPPALPKRRSVPKPDRSPKWANGFELPSFEQQQHIRHTTDCFSASRFVISEHVMGAVTPLPTMRKPFDVLAEGRALTTIMAASVYA